MTTKVYLAGGLRSGWQNVVINVIREEGLPVEFLDPRMHGLTDEKEYTAWDLRAVRESDIVFAYAERDNPAPFGLMLEIGVALDAAHDIIFAEDDGDPRSRYFGMARAVATASFIGLMPAVFYLKDACRECTA